MALTEARALASDLRAAPWDAERLARSALEVTTALLAASPRVAWAGGGGSVRPAGAGVAETGLWWVDAAGLGSETKLAVKLHGLAGELGFGPVRVGIADSAIAAHAATYARGRAGAGASGQGRTQHHGQDVAPAVIVPPGGDAAFLAPFPLSLLELDDDLAETLRALGLTTLGQVATLHANEVESRFGPEGLAAYRLACGLDVRGPSAPRDDALPVVACDLGSPVATTEPLLFVLKGALVSLGAALRAKGLAAREVLVTLSLDDGTAAEKAVRPARPTSHEGALFDHCRAAFENWTLPEPVVALGLRAAVTIAASGEQGDLLVTRWTDPAALDAAFDRIRRSEGADAVAMPAVRDGHLPQDEGAWEATRRAGDPAPRPATGTPPKRRTNENAALRLLPEPVPVRVRLGRAGLESFRYHQTWHDVTAWSGPERLAPRWWLVGSGPQDGYTARATDGSLWRLFRTADSRQWFVEGWWD